MAGIIDYFRLRFHQRYYSVKKIEQYQQKQLKKLVAYAVKKSPFYRDLYHSKPFLTMEDYHQLPVINKQIMMDHLTELNTIGAEKEELIQFALKEEGDKESLPYYKGSYVVGMSSGTSGNMGIYLTSRKLTRKLPFVFLARSGIPLTLLPFNILFLLRINSPAFEEINAPFIKLKYLSTMTDIKQVVGEINQRKINILMAPPSFIRMLLPMMEDIRIKPRMILTYAEVLTLEERLLFKERFGCPVIEIYQASEGQMASTCKCGNLHINEDLVYMELYDENNQTVKDRKQIASKMIITNLVNYAQPLIRYEMNDLIQLGEKCPCGSNFRRIDKIIGRSDDILYFFNGESKEIRYIFPDLFARWVITESENIREFQVINKKPNEIEVTIDLFEDQPGIEESLKSRLLGELGAFDITAPEIEIRRAAIQLPADKNKFKRFQREF